MTPPQIQLRSKLLPAMASLAAVLQLIDPSPVWRVLLVGLGGAWLIGYLWVRVLARSLVLRREMRFGWAQVGDRLEERFTLHNDGGLPATWVEIHDQSSLPGYGISRVTSVGWRSQTQWRTEGICTQRGIFTLGPTSLQTGDPLGIYQLTLHDPASTTLMVMPPIVPLPEIQIAPGGRTGEGRPRANAPERTVSASTVREFLPGDSLRLIHWRTSAKRDDLFIRLLEGTPAGDWWIFLDLDQQVQAGQGWDSTGEHGIILAASLADRGLHSRQAVGFVANGQELIWMPPREGEGQRWEILRALAVAAPGAHPLAELLARNRAAIGRRTSLVIITPNTTGDWIEAVIPFMRRGSVPTVLLLDPYAFDPSLDRRIPAGKTLDTLAGLGIARFLITPGLLDRPEARPGQQGQWEFRVTPSGRAIPIRQPADLAWKEMR